MITTKDALSGLLKKPSATTKDASPAGMVTKPSVTAGDASPGLPKKPPSSSSPAGKPKSGPVKIDLKSQIAKRLKNLPGFGQ